MKHDSRTIETPRALIVLLVACGAAILSVGCGGGGSSSEELQQAREQGASHARQQQRLRNLEKELRHIKRNGPSSSTATTNSASSDYDVVTEGSMDCGDNLTVGVSTTCAFARNVRSDYFSYIGSGSGYVTSYSPATGRTYEMYCTAGAPHSCTGGNNASVFFP